MHDVVTAAATRAPVGSFNGALASLSAHDLGAIAIEAACARAGVAAADVHEVIMGQVLTAGEGQNPARQAPAPPACPITPPPLASTRSAAPAARHRPGRAADPHR